MFHYIMEERFGPHKYTQHCFIYEEILSNKVQVTFHPTMFLDSHFIIYHIHDHYWEIHLYIFHSFL